MSARYPLIGWVCMTVLIQSSKALVLMALLWLKSQLCFSLSPASIFKYKVKGDTWFYDWKSGHTLDSTRLPIGKWFSIFIATLLEFQEGSHESWKIKNAAHVINQGKHDESIPQNEPQESIYWARGSNKTINRIFSPSLLPCLPFFQLLN